MRDDDPDRRFRSWLADHGGAVLRVARAYTRTAEDRQDLAQQILLQVWRSLPRFEGRADLATWSYRVALNTAMGWHRRERRRRARQRPILEAADPPAAGADAAQRAADRELVERLYAAIRRLPATDAALVLLDLDGLSDREIAEVLGVSVGNVGVKLHRARRALGRMMNEVSHEP